MGQENPLGQENPASDSSDTTEAAPKAAKGLIIDTPKSEKQDANDERALRHGRETHTGFRIGHYLQPPPFFFTRDKHPLPLVDMYRGHPAFLIASGPSFAALDHSKLRQPGVLTMGLNNSVKTFRPNLWTCVDDPANFIIDLARPDDPEVRPDLAHRQADLQLQQVAFMTTTTVGECPNIAYYKRNERFKADQYLWEDTINWGNHTNLGGVAPSCSPRSASCSCWGCGRCSCWAWTST
jgi:hypothetical protein